MDTLLRDVRYALRALLRRPGFTAAVTITLALGIGANTAIFSVIDGVLIEPLPFEEPDRLVVVWERAPMAPEGRNVVSPANYLDWRAQSTVFSDIAAYVDWRTNLTGVDEPEEIPTAIATASFFTVLGARAQLGRVYTAEEDRRGADGVVVISHALWQRRFGGRADILNSALTLDGRRMTIVGVMPPGFGMEGSNAELWAPMGLDPSIDYRTRTGRYLTTIARLEPGVTAERAQAEMSAIAGRLAVAHPRFNAGWGVRIVPLTEEVVGGVRRALLVLGGGVAFVLLIACANVANLLLVRATARSREIAVRAALGAGRRRMVRQLLTESIVLAVVGAAAGLLIAFWGIEAVRALAPASVPRVAAIEIDGRTLLFTAVLAVVTGVAFGLFPALHTVRSNLQDVLKEGARGATGSGRSRDVLVVAQVALSLVLLIGAGLMIRSFARLQAVDPGFDPENVLTARVSLTGDRYDEPASQTAFFESVLTRVSAIPGVESAGAITWLPFNGPGSSSFFWIDGRPVPPPEQRWVADVRGVDTSYFRTMRIRLGAGVSFDARASAPSPRQVVVNEALVRAYFGGENPIGRFIMLPWGDTLRGEIVGVVGDTKHAALDSLARPTLFWPLRQFPNEFMTLVVRSRLEPPQLGAAIEREVRLVDPNQPVADIRPLESYLGQSVAQRRFSMALLAGFAAVALVLAAVGIYGVLAYSVAQRTREIGVRMALGARESVVAGMVVREGLAIVALGLVIGVGGALLLTRVLRGLLFEVSPTDPVTFAAVCAVLGAVALAASYFPARRAARVDPMMALRSE